MRQRGRRLRKPAAGWRFGTRCAVIGIVVLGIVGWLTSRGDPAHIVMMAAFGLVFGLLVAPSLQPDAFRRPALVQTLCGIATGGLIALLLAGKGEAIAFGMVAGGLIGWLAPVWLRDVTLP